jgi:hypothetical protein
MAPTYRAPRAEQPALPFDVTQEIDPVFSDLLQRNAEPTLTESDFESLTPDLPRFDR